MDPVVPYFVASGHYAAVFDYQYSTYGKHKWTGELCGRGVSGYLDCELDFYPWPYASCIGDVCKVYYTGTNELATFYLNNHLPQGRPMRWGILMSDFPGAALIAAIIDANMVYVIYLPAVLRSG